MRCFAHTCVTKNGLLEGVSRIACMKCTHCESGKTVKAGANPSGSQRYYCKECHRHFTPEPKPKGYAAEVREQAVKMVVDGANFRRTGRYLKVNHQTVVNWFNAATAELKPAKTPRPVVGEGDVVELDELFTFVGDKKTKPTSSRKSIGKHGVS